MTTLARQQPPVGDPDGGSTRASAWDFPHGHIIETHEHPGGQLAYAITGVMTVTTENGCWVVPPQRALWVPPRVPHEVHMSGSVAMRTVYVDPLAAVDLPCACSVLAVSPLLRELIVAAVAAPPPHEPDSAGSRLFAVLLDEISAARTARLHLPMPRDHALRSLAESVRDAPSEPWTLASCAKALHMSERTLARAFIRETGMTFGQWRRQAGLLEGLSRLAAGSSVTEAAAASGYASTSAFIAMFRRATGFSPTRYLATRTEAGRA